MSCVDMRTGWARRLFSLFAAVLIAGCASTGGGPGKSTAKPETPQGQLHAQAVSLVQSGDVVQAEQLFLEMTQSYPNYATPWLNVALLRYKRGDSNGAGEFLAQALVRDPQLAPAWNLQGVIAREINNIDAAEKAYRDALAADASYAPAWLNLGILLEIWRGQRGAAMQAYQKYVELTPDESRDPRVAGWIADLQRRLDRGA